MTVGRVRPLLTRQLRSADLIALDVLAAVGLALLAGYAASDPPAETGMPASWIREPLWLTILLTLAVSAPIAVRRRWPLPVLTVVSVGILASLLFETVPIYASPAVFVPLTFALYQVALTAPPRRSGAALLTVLAGTLVVVLVRSPPFWGDAVAGLGFLGMLLGGAWSLGRLVRERRAYAERSAEQSARQVAQEAKTDERLRIARELHDIVAHSMSVITVKAAVANHVAESRPQELRAALRDIESTSRSALTELRRTLGVLRAGAPGPLVEFGPAPGIADLPELVERAGQAGVRAVLTPDVTGGTEPPEDVGRSVYRLVQEALTNVVKHAGPVRCRVTVRAGADAVRVEVTNDPGRPSGPADPRGQGLIGMRERVDLYGGTFVAGPSPDGGFQVSVHLPYQPAAVPVPAAGRPGPAPSPSAPDASSPPGGPSLATAAAAGGGTAPAGSQGGTDR